MDLPLPVREDLANILPQLLGAGLEVKSCQFSPETFGNYLVCFASGTFTLDITRDRGQYILGGNRQLLQQLGYWRALESKQELAAGLHALLAVAV